MEPGGGTVTSMTGPPRGRWFHGGTRGSWALRYEPAGGGLVSCGSARRFKSGDDVKWKATTKEGEVLGDFWSRSAAFEALATRAGLADKMPRSRWRHK